MLVKEKNVAGKKSLFSTDQSIHFVSTHLLASSTELCLCGDPVIINTYKSRLLSPYQEMYW